MFEFNNRISAQRDILMAVNSFNWNEELYGMSDGALKRWLMSNKIEKDSKLAELVYEAAGKLFFLANKSQEQITEEYKHLSLKIGDLVLKIKSEVAKRR